MHPGRFPVGTQSYESCLDQARALHRRLPVTASYFEYYGYDSLFKDRGAPQCDLEKVDAANVRAFGIAVANGGGPPLAVGPQEAVPAGDATWALDRLIRIYDRAMQGVRSCPRVRIVETAADLNPRADADAIHVIPLVTSHLWMRDLDAIDLMFRRGLRISHCAGETWCRSCGNMRIRGQRPPILSEFGRTVIARMNELGIVLDMAHMSDESAEAIIEASRKPVIDGHTGSRTAVPESRGLRDTTLRRIADRGGVAGVHFADHLFTRKVWGAKYDPEAANHPNPLWEWHRHLLTCVQDPEERMRLRKNRPEQEKFFRAHHLTQPPPEKTERLATVGDMAEHVDHLIHVMGVDHVGLGGDVNGITDHSWPLGMDHVGELPHLTAELLRRGHTETEMEKFLSGNWLRVFRECLP
jgi:membrane dipeptidase